MMAGNTGLFFKEEHFYGYTGDEHRIYFFNHCFGNV